MNHDDDLPVLTQVLRTGAGQDAPLWRPSLPEFDDAFDFRPIEYALTLRQYIADGGLKEDGGSASLLDATVDTPVLHDVISVAGTGERALDASTIGDGRTGDAASEDAMHARFDRGAPGDDAARRDADGPEAAFKAPSAESGGTGPADAPHDHDSIPAPQHGHPHETVAQSDRFDESPSASDPAAAMARDAAPSDVAASGAQHAYATGPSTTTGVPEIVADPRRLGGRDAFALPQDTDPGAGAGRDAPEFAPSLDAPPLALDSNDPALEPAGHDTLLHFPLRSLAERVRVAVYDDLTSRIRTELDARIAQAMHVEVENALAQMQDRLRVQLTDALRDVVGRAVDEEIARIEWSAATRDTPP